MNWIAITRHSAAVAGSIVLAIALTSFAAGDVTWSDRLGMAGFFALVAVSVVTMVQCHRYQMR